MEKIGEEIHTVHTPKGGILRNSLIFVAVVLFAICLFGFVYLKETSWFLKETLFEREMDDYQSYINDDFDGYEDNSEILDQSRENLSRWENAGSFTAWVEIKDWEKIDRLDLVLTDSDGKSVTLQGLKNEKNPREDNLIKSNDVFADYEFNCDQKLKTWEDFLLVNGTNFVFWEYTAPLGINMSAIESWRVVDGEQALEAEDVVIHDGLCDDRNSLNGQWHTPNGLPQYGVWWTENGQLRMRNVEQEQYPSNGDHVRILSELGTPKSFLLRSKFTIINVDKNVENTYYRLAWDFDDQFDPGHDETIVYNTFKYKYLGVQRVFPIERYFVQGNEPQSSDGDAKTPFVFKEGKTYELNIKVDQQDVYLEVYKLKNGFFKREAKLQYSFKKDRPTFGYPFAVETTGNVEIALDNFEVWSK